VPGKNAGEAPFNFDQDDCGLQPPSVAFSDPNSGVNFAANFSQGRFVLAFKTIRQKQL